MESQIIELHKSQRKIFEYQPDFHNEDSENSQIVLDMLQTLNKKFRQTIVMITHDSEAAAIASRILEMRDGRILNRVKNLFYAVEPTSL